MIKKFIITLAIIIIGFATSSVSAQPDFILPSHRPPAVHPMHDRTDLERDLTEVYNSPRTANLTEANLRQPLHQPLSQSFRLPFRKKMGIWVVLFLSLFLFVTIQLNASYWKHVK